MGTGWAIGLMLAVAPSTLQQTVPHSPTPPTTSRDDVVVEGIRVPGDEIAPAGDVSGGDPRESAVANRIKLELATRVAKCAVRGGAAAIEQLRSVVDGRPNDATQRHAQGRLLQMHVACNGDTSVTQANAIEIGTSLYDRGALTIEAMRRFAPDMHLTRADTRNASVQMRLDQREVPRNRQRLPVDQRYFRVAICMVRLQPTLSVRLALEDRDPAATRRIESAIVSGARICVGDARKVLFDATQFRLYIADAVYRWVVAARGVDSLIPA